MSLFGVSDPIRSERSASLIPVYHRLNEISSSAISGNYQQPERHAAAECGFWATRASVRNQAQQGRGGALSGGRSFTLMHLRAHVQAPQCIRGQERHHGRRADAVFVVVFPMAQSGTSNPAARYRHGSKSYRLGKNCRDAYAPSSQVSHMFWPHGREEVQAPSHAKDLRLWEAAKTGAGPL